MSPVYTVETRATAHRPAATRTFWADREEVEDHKFLLFSQSDGEVVHRYSLDNVIRWTSELPPATPVGSVWAAGDDLDYRGRLKLTDAENAIYVIARDALGRPA